MDPVFRYVVSFESDTDPAFVTVISLDSPVTPDDVSYTPHLIVEQARAISRLHDGDKPCSLSGYSVRAIIHNTKTIVSFNATRER